MDQELYIDGHLIDLGDDTTIAITKQINDIGDIESRNGDLSNQFKVPFTANNHAAFGFSNMVESTSDKPYRKLSARFIDRGIEIVPTGYAIIEQASDCYKITVYAGNADFFALIEGLNLRDLDYSALNHAWSIANIVSARLNTDNYLYGIIDWGDMPDTGTTIKSYQLFPTFFTHTIVQKIIEEQGWTFEGAILDDDMYKRLLLTGGNEWKNPNTDTFNTTELSSPKQVLNWYTSPEAWDSHLTTIVANDLGGTPHVLTNVLNSPLLELEDATNFSGNTFIAPLTGAVVFNINVKFKYTSGDYDHGNLNGPKAYVLYLILWNQTQNILYAVETMKVGAGFESPVTGNAWVIPNVTDYERQWDFTAGSETANDIKLIQGDVIKCFVHSDGDLGPQAEWEFEMDIEDISFSVKYNPAIIKDSIYDLAAQLPDMTQKDFLKGIFNLFCISPDSIGWNKTVKLRSYSELKSNMSKAKIWGPEIFTSEPRTVSYRIGNYGQKNNCLYIQEGETTQNFISRGLGNASFSIDDETLEQSVDVIKLPFAATEMVKRLDNAGIQIDVPFIDFLDDVHNLPSKKVTARLLMLRKEDQDWDLTLDDDVTTSNISTDVPYCHFILDGRADNIGFNNFLDLYYPPVLDSLNRAKMVSEPLNLKAMHLQNFDHFIPIYSTKYSCYFYMNKINNFKSGYLTLCDLIRL